MGSDATSSPLSSTPSSPLSFRSQSPTPPPGLGLPSPSLSAAQLSDRLSSPPDGSSAEQDGAPPAKKRKIADPIPRTTEYLDLDALKKTLGGGETTKDEYQLQRLLHALRTKRKIVVIAGAGISVSAGIPDFRSSTGLFKTLRETHKLKASGKHLFDASVYKNDDSTESFHQMVREMSHLTRKAKPTPFHHMIAALAEEGRLLRLYSQNVDGIDTSMPALATNVPLNAKGPWPKTIQLHGGLEKMVCTKCGDLSDFNGELFEGPKPPTCRACEEMDILRTNHAGKRSHGIGRLRPRIVLYNEFNPDDEAIGAVSAADLRCRPDCVLVVGTSLKVPGVRRIAREMCQVARGRKDGFTAWINQSPEPVGNEFKDCWDLVVRGACDEVAYQSRSYTEITRDDLKKIKQIQIESAANKVKSAANGFITPSASPRGQSPTVVKPFGKVKPLQLGLARSASTTDIKAKAKTQAQKPATKRRSRKSEPVKATQKITTAFTVSKKSATVTDAKSKAIKKEKPDNAGQPPYSDAMQPISMVEVRNNSEGSIYIDDKKSMTFSPADSPRSPIASSTRCDTISPRNTPNNMAHLID